MRFDGEHSWVCDSRYGDERSSDVHGWVNRGMYWGGLGTVIRCEKATYADMHFICCTEEEVYARRLAFSVSRWS